MNQYYQLASTEADGLPSRFVHFPEGARSQCKRTQRGFDLVQIAIVVGVIGVLMAAAFMGVPRVMASVRATGEAQDLQAFALAHQEIPATVVVDGPYLLSNNLYPRSQYIAAKAASTSGSGGNATPEKYLNRFGGDVVFAQAGLITTVTTKNIPSLACEKLIPIVAGSFRTVTIGGSAAENEVKAANGPLSAPKAYKDLCQATPTVDIALTLKR